MARKPPKGKSLAEVNPKLAKQWHTSKNGDLTPDDVSYGSEKEVWWKCDKYDDHEWESRIYSRNQGHGCPSCATMMSRGPRKPSKGKSLAEVNPELAKKWHPNKNGDLAPKDVFAVSGIKVWWKCDKYDDHEWESNISVQVKRDSCPVCKTLAVRFPHIAKEWHPNKNGDLTPSDVTDASGKDVWWKCNKGDDHEWFARIASRTRQGSTCPICSGRMIIKSNSLQAFFPEISKQWHPTKNGDIKPYQISPFNPEKVWWKCDKGDDHEWDAAVGSRTKEGATCPICCGREFAPSNSLTAKYPELAKEWHPTKNGKLTPENTIAGGQDKIWWKCNRGDDHEWRTSIIKRKGGTDCPFCTLSNQSRQELTITFELIKFFNGINPKGFKRRVNNKLWSIDIYISELKLGVEFDGSYWHKDKSALDKFKTEELEGEGIEIFRVREEPLDKIFDDDIISKKPFNGKQVVNDILTQIMSRYTLDAKKITKIESYIAKKELQNEKGLDKYIDMILTEKAEKKSNLAS